MVAWLKSGSAPAQFHGPTIETPRLILRSWKASDIAPNTAMLADPETARFITPDHKAVTNETTGWRNAAVIAGHWALYGFGMFAVEERSSGRYVGRVGPWYPAGWPGFEVGWGIAKDHRGKGYAVEAARAAIDWVFANLAVDRIIHCIDPVNAASQSVARRLGAKIDGQAELNGDTVDIWVTDRDRWTV
ncbi:GNAT family N-acetyltransferase [Bradyrhizobium sp. Leo121]|uniref:GNAT family N-acetyltransferase n=1 Tax=Bradyrhizobium sp. Leo121 TaxID=1571195 RepID=UPI0010295C7E|nr:GNAT family N-acetyltransferase [Bradyrhizobium sp. Leo121]RZN18284.1 N-acetyltransferase [Bradyrhizobium sp. Leo121]